MKRIMVLVLLMVLMVVITMGCEGEAESVANQTTGALDMDKASVRGNFGIIPLGLSGSPTAPARISLILLALNEFEEETGRQISSWGLVTKGDSLGTTDKALAITVTLFPEPH